MAGREPGTQKGGREGLGDDQGTRVGRPDPAPAAASEGDNSRGAARPTGMGSEASEGVHGADGRDESDTSSVAGDRGEGAKGRKGSEPMDRNQEHRSGYGGSGGAPVSSSDQRESHPGKGSK